MEEEDEKEEEEEEEEEGGAWKEHDPECLTLHATSVGEKG